MSGFVGFLQFRLIRGVIAPFGMGGAPEHRDNVVEALLPQRVAHDVETGPAPQDHLAAEDSPRDFLSRYDRAMGDVPAGPGPVLGMQHGTYVGVQSVGRDKSAAVNGSAISGQRDNAVVAFHDLGDP